MSTLTDKHGVPLVGPDGATLDDATRMRLRRQLAALQQPCTQEQAAQIAQQVLIQVGPQVVAQVLNGLLGAPNGLLSLLEARYGLTPTAGHDPVPPYQMPPKEAASDAPMEHGEAALRSGDGVPGREERAGDDAPDDGGGLRPDGGRDADGE